MTERISFSFKLTTILVALLFAASFAAWAGGQKQKSASSSSGKKTFTVGFIPGVTNDPFYIAMHAGVMQEAKKLGIKVDYAGSTQWDPTQQTPIVDSMISKNIDLLIVTPTSTSEMVQPLKQVHNAGIPIITVDTNISDSSILVSNITSNNQSGGFEAGQYLAKLLHDKGEIAVIKSDPGITTSDLRAKGFEEAISQHKNMKVVSVQYSNDQPSKVAEEIQQIHLAHPKLAGAFGVDLESSQGLVEGVQSGGFNIPIVAFDASTFQVKALKKGELVATMAQKPLMEGKMAIDFAYDYLTGQKSKIKKQVYIKPVLVTPQNMNQPSISQWFYINQN